MRTLYSAVATLALALPAFAANPNTADHGAERDFAARGKALQDRGLVSGHDLGRAAQGSK